MAKKIKQDKEITKSVFKRKLLLPLILLSLASYGVVQLTPILVRGTHSNQPSTLQLALVGTAIIILSSLFLKYAAKAIGMTPSWLVLGVLFSSCIVITKFILIPEALYSQVFTLSGLGDFDPNDSQMFFIVAVELFILYAGIFGLAYHHYVKRINHDVYHQKTTTSKRKNSRAFITVLISLGFVALVSSGAGAILLVPLIIVGPIFPYINYAIAGGGLLLVLTTVVAIVLSIKYLEHASNQAIEMKNVTILTITFWVGLSLILVFHILWVIYMGILLAIWPFRTISPSGK